MARQQATGNETEAAGGAKRAGRRGVIAAAAALAAGLLAKNAADAPRVAATSGGGDQGFLALGSNPWYLSGFPSAANTPAVSSSPTVIQASPNFNYYGGYNGGHHVLVEVDASTNTVTTSASGTTGITGIHAVGYGVGDGVDGHSNSGTGIYGESITGTGVYGNSSSYVGVRGSSNANSGVYGNTNATPTTPTTPPIAGVYGVGNGTNTAGVSGDGDVSGFGVYGHASGSIGVYGISGGGSAPFGVVGSVTSAPGFALYGVVNVAGAVGFAAGAGVSGAIAGQFSGPVNIYNNGSVAPGNLYTKATTRRVARSRRQCRTLTVRTACCTAWSLPTRGSRTSAPARWQRARRR